MAIFHLSAKIISRKAGRSATGAAAYRAGEKVIDERTGEVHDYSRKRGVEHAEIVMPSATDWRPTRAELWNAAELKNKRADAQVAREFVIALPDELPPEARKRLALGFAREIADRYSVAADVAIHAPSRGGDNRNHHAHILTTTNRVEGHKLGNKARELDHVAHTMSKHGQANEIDWLRERWTVMANASLEQHGHAERIDHRSLEAQGIDREPTQHLGPAATGYERRTGQPSHKRQQHNEDALERLQRAREAGELERQGKEADRSIIDLSGDLEAAKRERATQQERQAREREQAERQRIERMTSTELAHEIARLRPPSVADLVERDQAVTAARDLVERLSDQHQSGQQQEARAKEQAEQWREQHKIQAWLHDKGIGHAPKLRELDEQREAGRAQWLTAAPRIEDAMLSKRNAEQEARERIRFEQAPALAKVAELEALRREKVRQEMEQQKRQEVEKKAEHERTAVPQDFRAMAAKREAKASGWSDRGEQWKAAPQGLRTLIDGYNAVPKEKRPIVLDRILNDSQRREQVRELMEEQRQQYRANDRGMER